MVLIFSFYLLSASIQERIDEFVPVINNFFREDFPSMVSYNAQKNFSPFHLLSIKKPTSDISYLADIVIGDTPGETLFVPGYFYNAGNIIIINDGVLNLKNADFNLDGNIYVLNQGRVLADSSSLRFLQDYIYQYGIFLFDSAQFILTNSSTRFNGYPFEFSAGGFSNVTIRNTVNYDWTTAMLSGQANADLNNVGITGEWLFSDFCFARFNRVDNFLSWYFFPESSVIDIKFPDGAVVNGFFIDSTLQNVDGIGYHIEIDSSTNCMWAAIPLEGSDVTIDSSLLRVTGLLLGGDDSLTLSGLVNGLYYEDYTLPLLDRNYHLTYTTVQTWNIYPFDSVSLELFSSIFGELCAYGNTYGYIHNAFCDGSGGHLESSDNAFLITVLSSISADIISKGHSICIIVYCAMPWGNIWATGSSIMLLVNSNFPVDPIPFDTSLVFVLAITGPNNGNVNDLVPILGSAWIDKGPYQPLDFGYYQVFYRAETDTFWIPVSDSCFDEVRRDTLCYWNTTGLNPGNYIVRLVLKDNGGDSVDCLKLIPLYEMDVDETGCNLFAPIQILPNPFDDFIIIEGINQMNADLSYTVYDVSGGVVQKSKLIKSVIELSGLSSGIYFICINNGTQRVIKKIVKIR